MKQYLELVKYVLENGEQHPDRTGTGILSVFGTQTKYDLGEGFPLVTTKKTLFSAVIYELLWFLRGSTNINDDLIQHTPIWNAWADRAGELGPIYGYQWRKWPKHELDPVSGKCKISHIDQIQNAIDAIKTNPDSRRIIVSAWNVSDLDQMALPPCHLLFQFYVSNSKRLDCQLYQRSADIALGVPFNIASYSALMIMIAQECGLVPGIFTHTLGNAHIYLNHVEGLREQLKRKPHPLPTLEIAKKPFWEIQFTDFSLKNYTHEPFIRFPIAV